MLSDSHSESKPARHQRQAVPQRTRNGIVAAGERVARVAREVRQEPVLPQHREVRAHARRRLEGGALHRVAVYCGPAVFFETRAATVADETGIKEFAAGVDEALGERGYVTLLGCSNESAGRQTEVLGSLMQQHPAAIILSPAEVSAATDVAAAIGQRTPLLVFNRALDGEVPQGFGFDFLGLDNRNGARLATASEDKTARLWEARTGRPVFVPELHLYRERFDDEDLDRILGGENVQRQGVGADVCADVEHGLSRPDDGAVGPHGGRLEASEQVDRKIDSFAKIELPADCAANELALRAQAEQPAARHDRAAGDLRQRDLLRGAKKP